jgi:hypothetical protein
MNFKKLKNLSVKQIRMIIMGVIIIISAIIMEEVLDDIFSDPSQGDPETLIFDTAVLKKLQSVRGIYLNQSMIDITALGSLIIPMTLKNYYLRARPDKFGHLPPVTTPSFPSGHSFGATIAYLSLA